MQMVVYPATYMTNWTDAFAADFSLGGFPVARTGTITAEVNGYGTMIMPYGTLTDVLRASYVEDQSDAGFGTTTIHREYTYFLQAGTHYPVVDIYSITVTPAFGPSTTVEGTHLLVVGPDLVPSASVAPEMVNVYPVPARDQLQVQLSGMAGNATIDLLDGSGRLITQRAVGDISQNRRNERIDLHGLDAGLYLLRVTIGGQVMVRDVLVE